MPHNPITLSVIIVSYNTRDLTLRCLHDLHAELQSANLLPTTEIFVVDNASADHSADAVAAQFPTVKLLTPGKNLGFGAANNLAMAKAAGQYFLLLNSDAFLHPGALPPMLARLAADPSLAALGCRLLCPDNSHQLSCFRFPTPARAWLENLWLASLAGPNSRLGDYSKWPHDSDRTVDFVIGACMLVRAAAYHQVGGFDESFFLYAEETDWQYRMTKAGWKIAFTSAAVATHIGGASGKPEGARVSQHFFDGLDRFSHKHFGQLGLLSVHAAMVVGCSLRAFLWTLLLLPPRRRPAARAKIRLHSWLVRRQLTSLSPPHAA